MPAASRPERVWAQDPSAPGSGKDRLAAFPVCLAARGQDLVQTSPHTGTLEMSPQGPRVPRDTLASSHPWLGVL